MKRPFDRIVGPDGVWKIDDGNRSAADDGASGDAHGNAAASERGDVRTLSDLDEREEFVFRCLNAAVNLYGALSADEFISLYNGYAKDHAAPVSDPLTFDELDRLVNFFLSRPGQEKDSESFESLAAEPDVWFSTLTKEDGKTSLIVYYDIVESALPDEPESPNDLDRLVEERLEIVKARIGALAATFRLASLHILPEEDFLCYEDPMCAEETKEGRAFAKFIKKEYRIEKGLAELDVMGVQSRVRTNGAKIVHALEYVRDVCDWAPSDHDAFMRLVKAVNPLVSTTRTWEGRGRTQQELYQMGVCPQFEKEDIYDVFGLDDDSGRDGEEDGWDDDEEGEMIYPEDVPLSVYNGPIDFKFVKDAERREAKVETYEDVRQITQDFVRKFVMRELTQDERRKGAERLGFLKKGEGLERLDPTLDCVVGDFASMLDDQGGEPAVRRVLAKKSGEFDEFDRRAASYYANYRYTWLEVLAAKSGVGVKCRDLLTGEELFLMEKSLSQGDVKGMTVCVGIAPMEDVCLAVGVLSPARFENPATILKIVLTHLGLPTETPVRLDAADQARFAAETIRRIHANGNYDTIAYS